MTKVGLEVFNEFEGNPAVMAETITNLRSERDEARNALDFVDSKLVGAYIADWSDEWLKVLTYDCRDRIKSAIGFVAKNT